MSTIHDVPLWCQWHGAIRAKTTPVRVSGFGRRRSGFWLRCRSFVEGRRTRLRIDAVLVQNAQQFVADAVSLLRLFLIAQLFFQQPEVVPRHGIVWVQFEGLFVIFNGTVGVPRGLFHPAARTVPIAVIGLRVGGLVEP